MSYLDILQHFLLLKSVLGKVTVLAGAVGWCPSSDQPLVESRCFPPIDLARIFIVCSNVIKESSDGAN
jgi:hypothetical protein